MIQCLNTQSQLTKLNFRVRNLKSLIKVLMRKWFPSTKNLTSQISKCQSKNSRSIKCQLHQVKLKVYIQLGPKRAQKARIQKKHSNARNAIKLSFPKWATISMLQNIPILTNAPNVKRISSRNPNSTITSTSSIMENSKS